jgi:hypothetical protein
VIDSYVRVTWRELEPQRDQYDFSVLDRALAAASARGGRLGFRIISADGGHGSAVPPYLMDLMPSGFWFDYAASGTVNTYAPDWNSQNYLDRAAALVNQLGAQYDRDPRLGFVDIGLYGDFGEWHVFRWPYNSAPSAATPITPNNAHSVIDMHLRAFPHKHLFMPSSDEESTRYALALSPAIGWRNDCLGTANLGGLLEQPGIVDAVRDRWKTAEVIAEYCRVEPGSGRFQRAVGQVASFHISQISDGNVAAWDSFSEAEKAQFLQAGRESGYRFVLDQFRVPATAMPGQSVSLVTSWSNIGVAPAYDPWNATVVLRDPASSQIVWKGVLGVDFERLLPTQDSVSGADAPVTIQDRFDLPVTLPAGQYQLSLTIEDPSGYYRPLALAIDGRRADGSYPIGTLSVVAQST